MKNLFIALLGVFALTSFSVSAHPSKHGTEKGTHVAGSIQTPFMVSVIAKNETIHLTAELQQINYTLSSGSYLVFNLTNGTEVIFKNSVNEARRLPGEFTAAINHSQADKLKQSAIKSITMLTDTGTIDLKRIWQPDYFMRCLTS